jgi:hypothetical protein
LRHTRSISLAALSWFGANITPKVKTTPSNFPGCVTVAGCYIEHLGIRAQVQSVGQVLADDLQGGADPGTVAGGPGCVLLNLYGRVVGYGRGCHPNLLYIAARGGRVSRVRSSAGGVCYRRSTRGVLEVSVEIAWGLVGDCRRVCIPCHAPGNSRGGRCKLHGGMSAGPRTEQGRPRLQEAMKQRWLNKRDP